MMRESKKKKRAKIAKKHANILMPKVSSRDGITNDDELENDVDNYEDSRIELRESGHNLTSVLMNPRVTLIDNYMDDFDQAQLLPLDSPEFLRAITALHGSSTLGQTSTPSCTSSLLSTAEYYLTPAHHEMNQTGRGSINGSSGSGTSDLNSSTSSIHSAVSYASLALTSSLRDYSNPQGAIASSYFTNSISRNIFHENRRMRSKGLPAPAAVSGSGVIQPSSPAFKSTSDVSYCFAHVPEIFFSHDFSLKDTDIFTEPAATSFHDEVEGVGGALRDDSMLERMKAAPRENDLNGSNVNGGRGSGRYSSALYTVDLDDDDDDDGDGATDREGNSSSPDARGDSFNMTPGLRKGKDLFNMETARVLTSYLDLVEVALLRQIITRSPSFFRALDDINCLHSYVSRAAIRVIHIRRQLRQTKDGEVAGDIRIPKLERRRRNEVTLNERIQCMQRVLMGRAMVRTLLQQDDYIGALEVIRSTQQVFEKQCTGILSMVNIGKELKAYDEHIAEVMSNRFVTLAVEWVDIDDVPEQSSASDIDNTLLPDSSRVEDVDGFKESFSQLLTSLLLVHKTPMAFEAYANRLADSVRLIVRTCLLEYINADVTESGNSESGSADNSFSSKVRNMSNENFLSCLQMCLESLLQSLKRSVAVHVFVCQIYAQRQSIPTHDDSTEVKDNENTMDVNIVSGDEDQQNNVDDNVEVVVNEGDEMAAAQLWAIEKSSSILTSISELAQKSICQLLLMRKESTAKLPLEQMKFLWDMVLNFVYTVDKFNTTIRNLNTVESDEEDSHNEDKEDKLSATVSISTLLDAAVVNLSTFPLRNGLLNQTKKFIEYLHESYKGKLVNTLDNEKWLQCDVPPERQTALDVLTSGRSLMQKKDNSNATSAVATSTSNSSNGSVTSKSKKKDLVPIVVDGNSFKIVWSALFLVEVILSYLDIAIQFAPITKDIIAKTVEILTLFDSRSKQLVLGAQAIQSAARLKSIAAKHLGIIAQSLTFLTAILPHLRAAFLSQLPPEHHLVLVEMDRVSKNIQDHHSKVLQKFVSIVGDFVDVSAQKLVVLDWDRFNGQCEYFDEVCRNVSALHRVLSVYLPPDQMQDVFDRIFSLLSRKIPSHFNEVMPSTQTGKQRIMDETVHLVHNFSSLKYTNTNNLTVEDTLRKKYEVTFSGNDSKL